MTTLVEAAALIQQFEQRSFGLRIASLERELHQADKNGCEALCQNASIGPELWTSALTLKQATGQINVVIHAVGILLSLPYILQEGEIIQVLSLGAGNTGKPFDLETNRRVAEFKFIHWKGGSEPVRKNQLFKDFYRLAEFEPSKERYLYVVGDEYPLKFFGGKRALSSVLSGNNKLWAEFQTQYGDRFSTVADYYTYRQARVRIVDLTKLVPHFASGFGLAEALNIDENPDV